MGNPAVQSFTSLADADHTRMLVFGYHGTLAPDTTSQPVELTTSTASPPQMEALLEPLLANARAQLDHRLPATQRTLGGELIPTAALLATLSQRLQEILTLPLAAQLATTDAPASFTHDQLGREYPALTSLIRLAVSEWVTATVTFLRRLQADSSRLAHWLGLHSLPPVESLSGTTADPHPGGHLVVRIVFHGKICIYYKPRPVTGEWLWHALLQSVAAADPDLRLPVAPVLPGCAAERFGWMESASPHPFRPDDVISPRYWHTAGAMLCLAHHARLTDLHLGNVIATPNGPAVTDAECLATPTFLASTVPAPSSQNPEAAALLSALTATGLLPVQSLQNMPDISGLFGCAAPAPGVRLPRWTSEPDGRFHLTASPALLLDHGNAPATSPLSVLPHLLDGYRQAAHALLRTRQTLLAAHSPWRAILEQAHAPRIVLRDTLTYALLLSQSLAPGHLRSEQSRRGALLDNLRQLNPSDLPHSLLRAELHSLLHLQLPRFILLPGTRTLAASSRRPLIRGFASSTPAQEVIHTMNNLSPDNLESAHIPALLLAVLSSKNSSPRA